MFKNLDTAHARLPQVLNGDRDPTCRTRGPGRVCLTWMQTASCGDSATRRGGLIVMRSGPCGSSRCCEAATCSAVATCRQNRNLSVTEDETRSDRQLERLNLHSDCPLESHGLIHPPKRVGFWVCLKTRWSFQSGSQKQIQRFEKDLEPLRAQRTRRWIWGGLRSALSAVRKGFELDFCGGKFVPPLQTRALSFRQTVLSVVETAWPVTMNAGVLDRQSGS
jgi:hypothetical protein